MRDFDWYDWIVLAVLLLMLVVGGALSPWGQEVLSADAAPAWVQALGSIAAVLAAWYASSRTSRQQRDAAAAEREEAAKQRVQQLQALNQIIRRLAGNGIGTVTGIRANADPEYKVRYASGRLRPMRAAAAALDRIEFHHLPYAYICVHALNVTNLLNAVIDCAESISSITVSGSFPEFEQAYTPKLRELLDLASAIERDLDTIQALVDAYDGAQDPNVVAAHL